MSTSKKPSPARSQSILTPQHRRSRRSQSLCSVASDTSLRLTSVITDRISLLPNQQSVLNDDTNIEVPGRSSWWKRLSRNSRDVTEVVEEGRNVDVMKMKNVIEELNVEVLSQEKENLSIDLPESSDNESIQSIVIPQRKLFTNQESSSRPIKKFEQISINKEMTLIQRSYLEQEKDIDIRPKKLFSQEPKQKTKSVFSTALLNVSANKTLQNPAPELKGPVHNLFGNRPNTKPKNVYAGLILTDSEEEIPDIQPKLFGFPMQSQHRQQKRSGSQYLGNTSTSNITDVEMDDWQHLPSSTMVDSQMEKSVETSPLNRTRASCLSNPRQGEFTPNDLHITNNLKQSIADIVQPIVSEAQAKIDMNVNLNDTLKQNHLKVQSRKSIRIINNSLKETTATDKDRTKSSHSFSVNKKTLSQNDTVEEANNATTEHQQDTNAVISEDESDEEIFENLDDLKNKYFNVNEANKTDNLDKNDLQGTRNSLMTDLSVIAQNENANKEIDLHVDQNVTTTDDEKQPKSLHDNNNCETSTEIINREVNNKIYVVNGNPTVLEIMQKDNLENECVELHKVTKEKDQKNNDKCENKDNNEHIHRQINERNNQEQSDNAKINTLNIPEGSKNSESVKVNDSAVKKGLIETDVQRNSINEIERNKEDQVIRQVDSEIKDQEIVSEVAHCSTSGEEDNEMEYDAIESDVCHEEYVSETDQGEKQNDISAVFEAQENIESCQEGDVLNLKDHKEQEQTLNSALQECGVETNSIQSDIVVQNGRSFLKEFNKQSEQDAEMDLEPFEQDQSSHLDNAEEYDSYEMDCDENTDKEDQTDDHNIKSNEIIPNITHDSTAQYRKEDEHLAESPEAILYNKTNQGLSFKAQGRNTSINKSKTIIKHSLSIQASLAPARESTGLSDGTISSSAEGSGWDSHRTTRRTLRQTFGKDFTPRKSLRTLVMERSAKRNTNFNIVNTEKSIYANNLNEVDANSPTKFNAKNDIPEFDSYHESEPVVINETQEVSDHEASRLMRQTTLENYLQKLKEDNAQARRKMQAEVINSLKMPKKEIFNAFKMPEFPKAVRRSANAINKPNKSKAKLKSCLFAKDMLPSEFLQDMKYRPPKRFQGKNAPWITKRLYKYLEDKLETKYDYRARVRSEQLVEKLYQFSKDVRRQDRAPPDAVSSLQQEMARLGIVRTYYDFYNFFHQFMPREVRIRVNPDIMNKIPAPDNVFNDIIPEEGH